ncbi:MAG: hypothetical protein C4617_00560 [Candidatus Liberibacter europaeus]|uniref:Fe/B12 periplasmic-binding domain-containing protein n=1 Tax=Candidatus Liberibacter europaeus TaxID=744859 RepID=A0A2T4VYV1_9HYPH|nr:MAG: hypothetical protein C4617_00560 [Candidatus Liberibacter europaeus]
MNISEINTLSTKEYNNKPHHIIEKGSIHNTNLKSVSNIKPVENMSTFFHVAKEVGLSSIPIYGTIRSFKNGEIGWGIFGIVTDVLTVIPVLGVSAKLAGSLIRGGGAAIKAGATTAEVIAKTGAAAAVAAATSEAIAKTGATATSEAIAKTGAAVVAATSEVIAKTGATATSEAIAKTGTISTETAIKESETIFKPIKVAAEGLGGTATKTTAEHSISQAANNTTKRHAKNLAKSVVRALDPGVEGTYQLGKYMYKKGGKLAGKLTASNKHILPYAIKSAPSKYFENILKLPKDTKWSHGNFSQAERVQLNEGMKLMFKHFRELDSLKLDKQFKLDINRAKYVINDKILLKEEPEKMLSKLTQMFSKDHKKLQIISSFANQTIFADPYLHLMNAENRLIEYSSINTNILYKIDTTDKNIVKITAKYETDLKKVDDDKELIKNIKKEKPLKSYGIRMEMTLSPEKIISAEPYFYIN